jgi:4-hydroxybenzoate polyprenyltransferase
VNTNPQLPLYVDLDGTVVRGDTLLESALQVLRRSPLLLISMLVWLCRGKIYFKTQLANHVVPSPEGLAYHEKFVDFLREQKGAGRLLYLYSAADERIVSAVSKHLGLFDGHLGTRALGSNLRGAAKLRAIEEHAKSAGHAKWAYAGDSRVDIPIWRASHEILAVAVTSTVLRSLTGMDKPLHVFPGHPFSLRTWVRSLRLVQWAKNLLIFVPLLASHTSAPDRWLAAGLGFIALGLCASATYLINDLLDLGSDRQHRVKRLRPLAAGKIPIPQAIGVAVIFLFVGLWLGSTIRADFAGLLGLYCVVTLSYSLHLKRIALVDVVVLASLYSLRLFAGAAAVMLPLSNWLVAFSAFIFLSLALAKRCAELEEATESPQSLSPGRGYLVEDLASLRTMGVASGLLSVLVLSLYIDSNNGRMLYAQPAWLWGLCPLMMLWIMRIWQQVGRRQLQGEDPLQHALSDAWSWYILAAMLASILMAKGVWL